MVCYTKRLILKPNTLSDIAATVMRDMVIESKTNTGIIGDVVRYIWMEISRVQVEGSSLSTQLRNYQYFTVTGHHVMTTCQGHHPHLLIVCRVVLRLAAMAPTNYSHH